MSEPEQMHSRVDIVIVNWNSGPCLRRCLASIAEAQLTSDQVERIVVVDNASSDDSAIDLSCGAVPVDLIRSPTNLGFAAACNLGAARCRAGYLLFLNPDVTVRPESLGVTLQFMERAANRNIGICGIALQDATGNRGGCCSRFPSLTSLLGESVGLHRLSGARAFESAMSARELSESRAVDQVIGAFFLVRRSLFDALRGFDERFFMYFEEVDFCLRARSAGFLTYFLADAIALHIGAASSDQVKGARLFYSLHSRLLYCGKHLSKSQARIVAVSTLLIEPLARAAWCLANRSVAGLKDVRDGYVALYKTLWGGAR